MTITGLPIPPSANTLYAFSRNADRMIKTKAYREYERSVQLWILKNQQQLALAREYVRDIGNSVLHVDASFYMLKVDIVCKNGKPKKNDTANRLKALHDILSSTILGLDDSWFWSGSFKKIISDKEFVDVSFFKKGIS